MLPHFLTTSNPEELYNTGNYVALDFETDSDQNGSALVESNDIVLACWHVYRDNKLQAKKHCFGGIYDMGELLDDVRAAEFLMAYNAKFEAAWLKRCGLDLHDLLVYDPLLAQWVLDGNRKGRGFERSLRAVAKRYGTSPKLDIVGKLFDSEVATRDINTSWLLEYCERDVDTMVEIYYKQKEEVSKEKMWHLVHTRNVTCTALADIEFNGLELDKERVYAEYARVMARKQELDSELNELTGGVLLTSSKQLATYLYDTLKFPEPVDHRGKVIRTEKGDRSTKTDHLAKLTPTTKEQEHFLELYKEYNRLDSLLTKNLLFFKGICDHEGSKFYGSIKQNATGTHRLASSGRKYKFPVGTKRNRKGETSVKYKEMSTQLQNVPREYKGLFWAAQDDYEVCSYDSSQIEFRMAVDMARDKVGYEEVSTGTDIHQFTAQVLYENGDPEICSYADPKDRRQHSKKSSFRPLFGGASGSPAIVAYCEYFRNKYVQINDMQRTWALQCVDKGYYTTPYGIKFYFDAELQRSGYITYSTSIYNYPIQGLSTGEIMPLALVHFWHKTRHLRCDVFVTIHDSIDARVHKDDIDEVNEIAIQCLTTDIYEYLHRVYKYDIITPLGLGLKHGKHWGDGKEIKYDVNVDGSRVQR